MEMIAQTCARLLVALEEIAEQEASALRERDFAAVSEFQARAQPLVEYLGKHGPAIANQAFLQRVRAFLTRRQSSYRWLAGEIEQTREALRQTQESVGRVTRIAPVYGSAVASVAERLSAVG